MELGDNKDLESAILSIAEAIKQERQGQWVDYTPTFSFSSGSISLGNWTNNSSYRLIDNDTVIVHYDIQFGSTTNFGSFSNLFISIPFETDISVDTVVGHGRIVGTPNTYMYLEVQTETSVQATWISNSNPPTPQAFGATSPATFNANTKIKATIVYRRKQT